MSYLQIEHEGKGCRVSLDDLKGALSKGANIIIIERAAYLAALHTDEELGYYPSYLREQPSE
jgi:hypothetical protein